MSHAFYPFVEEDASRERGASAHGDAAGQDAEQGTERAGLLDRAHYAARIAVYDDAAAAPRVIIIDPTDVRSYLEEITSEVTRLSHEQGGSIPFMVIREVVENLIHAYFIEPAISILDDGNTIRFADQGPGIKEKERALEYGTTSATDEMKRYIRGVGSGLPYARQYLLDKGGSLVIEDNISGGTIVTISMGSRAPHPNLSTSPQVITSADGFGAQAAPVMATTQVGIPAAGIAAAAPTIPASPVPQVAAPTPTTPAIALSARGEKVLAYLATHESVGPKELVEAYGSSQSTWTRELQALEEAGVVSKRGGQKRHLTTLGSLLLRA